MTTNGRRLAGRYDGDDRALLAALTIADFQPSAAKRQRYGRGFVVWLVSG
jgi:hypothetical protein